MLIDDYQTKALVTLAEKESFAMNRVHCILGLCTEIGELLDIVKKTVFYDTSLQTLDLKKAPRDKLMDELGDCFWYWAMAVYFLEKPYRRASDILDFDFIDKDDHGNEIKLTVDDMDAEFQRVDPLKEGGHPHLNLIRLLSYLQADSAFLLNLCLELVDYEEKPPTGDVVRLAASLEYIAQGLEAIVNTLEMDINDVLDKNLFKLRIRYEKNGGKFDEQAARIRDKQKEFGLAYSNVE